MTTRRKACAAIIAAEATSAAGEAGEKPVLQWRETIRREGEMAPGTNESRVVRRLSGQTTDGSDDILVDDRGQWWRALPPHEADATAPAPTGKLTRDGRIIW